MKCGERRLVEERRLQAWKLEQKPSAHISHKQEAERVDWEGLEHLNSQNPPFPRMTPSPPMTYLVQQGHILQYFQAVELTGDQVFKCWRLWATFSFLVPDLPNLMAEPHSTLLSALREWLPSNCGLLLPSIPRTI